MQYRDDDINVYTCVEDFRRIHRVFQKHNRVHTVACEMRDLWENKALFWMLLTDPLIDVELHGWTHADYSKMPLEDIVCDFRKAIKYWEENAKRMLAVETLLELKRITTYCATWNRSSQEVENACKVLGLKLHLGDCKWMFHWWSTTPEEAEQMLK